MNLKSLKLFIQIAEPNKSVRKRLKTLQIKYSPPKKQTPKPIPGLGKRDRCAAVPVVWAYGGGGADGGGVTHRFTKNQFSPPEIQICASAIQISSPGVQIAPPAIQISVSVIQNPPSRIPFSLLEI